MSRGSVSHNYEYISTYSNVIQQIVPDRFVLKIRQQPIQTRLSTTNERDRRPLDPPPIVQIELDHSTPQETQDFLQNPYLFMCVSLIHPTTHEEILNPAHNTLSGQSSSSMYKLKDINNHDGGFFVFGDVSVKLEGQFRLKFSMFEISKLGATNLKSIYSNVFQVFASKSFPGMLESTFLSRSFSDQGVRIRIRKEHRVQMTGSRKRKLSSQGEPLELEDRSSFLLDRSHPIYNQQFIQPQPSLVYTQQRHWPQENPYDSRRHSMMVSPNEFNVPNAGRHHLSHIDRRPSIPFSPPHQSYDSSRMVMNSNDYKPHYPTNQHYRNNTIPSPPPQTPLFKPELRRLSFDDTLTYQTNHSIRRLSADPHFYHYRRRRDSVQQASPAARQSATEVIHLPPLRSIVSENTMPVLPKHHHYTQDGIGEVDAAVAMMQLASRRQAEAKVNY
ncbi:hypothetical protein MFLAVUS_000405 [Mucor flavus]|uniref:Velvet domain-containing protein n=1 Tax=Mucor flavus TaxID=439312 RepID=A0ABP9YJL4_9FUNG